MMGNCQHMFGNADQGLWPADLPGGSVCLHPGSRPGQVVGERRGARNPVSLGMPVCGN